MNTKQVIQSRDRVIKGMSRTISVMAGREKLADKQVYFVLLEGEAVGLPGRWQADKQAFYVSVSLRTHLPNEIPLLDTQFDETHLLGDDHDTI